MKFWKIKKYSIQRTFEELKTSLGLWKMTAVSFPHGQNLYYTFDKLSQYLIWYYYGVLNILASI